MQWFKKKNHANSYELLSEFEKKKLVQEKERKEYYTKYLGEAAALHAEK